MADNWVLIKRYNHIYMIGTPYLIIDYLRDKDGPSVKVHEIFIHTESLQKDYYKYRYCIYDLKDLGIAESKIKTVLEYLLNRHLVLIKKAIRNENGFSKFYLNLEEVASGVDAIYGLQFNEVLVDLMQEIIDSGISSSLDFYLDNLEQVPINSKRWIKVK